MHHPAVQQQAPRIILVTTPPINEYMTDESDLIKGITEPRRKAEHTKLYADAVRDVAEKHNVTLLDLWAVFMRHAGWQGGDAPLLGSRSLPPNSHLRMLMHDGSLYSPTRGRT